MAAILKCKLYVADSPIRTKFGRQMQKDMPMVTQTVWFSFRFILVLLLVLVFQLLFSFSFVLVFIIFSF